MKTVQKSVLIWYSAEQMFSLVTQVDQYPHFLPFLDESQRQFGGDRTFPDTALSGEDEDDVFYLGKGSV